MERVGKAIKVVFGVIIVIIVLIVLIAIIVFTAITAITATEVKAIRVKVLVVQVRVRRLQMSLLPQHWAKCPKQEKILILIYQKLLQ